MTQFRDRDGQHEIKIDMKKYIIFFTVIIVALWGYFYFSQREKDFFALDHKNATYIIDGKPIKLTNGLSEIEDTSGSATKIITRYFDNEVTHDLNGDSKEDVVFLLTQETGGSGLFYYVVAALNTENGYVGSHALFLGDRISPQNIHMDEGETAMGTNRENVIVVNYFVRQPDKPFTAEPSINKNLFLKLDPTTMQFGEVVQDFEGESR